MGGFSAKLPLEQLNLSYSGFETYKHYPMERVNNDSTYYDYIDQIPKDQENEGYFKLHHYYTRYIFLTLEIYLFNFGSVQ